MRRAILILILFVLLSCSLSVAAISMTAPELADTAAAFGQRPDSALDLIAQQRELELARQHRGRLGWWFAGGLLLVAVVFAGVLLYRRDSADYLKQRRLAARQAQRRRRQPLPPIPQAPAVPTYREPQPPHISGPQWPQLPDGRSDGRR